MSKQTNQLTTIELPSESTESTFDINYYIKKYIFHWPLFLIGVILSCSLGYLYIKVTNPVYPVVAALKFNVPTAASTGVKEGNKNPILLELDPISQPVIVENEIEVIQSKKLMFEVVKKLELWVTYTKKEGLLTTDLYKSTPVKFKFLKQAAPVGPEGKKLKVKIKDHNSYTVEFDDGTKKTMRFGEPITSSFGTWGLFATPALDANIGSTINVIVQDPDLVTEGYQKGVKAALEDKNAPFVNLTTSDIVPQRGKDVLNALLEEYQKAALADKFKDSQKTLDFINSRFDSVKRDLDTVERKIASYKSSQLLTDAATQAQSYQSTKQTNVKSLSDINLQLAAVESFEKAFDESPKNQRIPAIAGITDQSLVVLYDDLNNKQLTRDQNALTLPAKNPAIVALDKEITTMQGEVRAKIQAIKASLLANKKELQSSDSGNQAALSKIPLQDKEYSQMKRDQETKEKRYNYLMELKEAISMRYAASVSDSEIVDDAHSGKVKWPIVPMVYAFAFILGLVAPAGLLYARESLNEYIISKQQIEDETNVPVIGELSHQSTNEPIVVTEGRGKFAIGEQFRVLRTNLYHLHGNSNSGRVTLFTSSIGSEGKSFVTSNLAVTLAYASRKTIVLEMDLRKPRISENFNLSSDHPGISEYLAEESFNLDKLIQPTNIKGLDIMSCGPIHPNPSELLEKNTLDDLITKLKERYDDILIDSPPIHLVTDSKIIARVADASLYLVRQGHTKKEELEFISEMNASNWFPKLSIVFNDIQSEKFGYGYNTSNSYYNSYNTKRETPGFGSRLRKFLSRF